ncbi:MAG: ABC transporter substrate-binding protein [Nitrososphaerota archaeon]|nr:ABC transporter substrate-binding protein [Nitrososphaerota archaeon]
MNNKTTIFLVILIALVVAVSVVVVYNEFYKTSASLAPEPSTITVVDGAGYTVTVTLPVSRVVVTGAGLGEILCSMGAQDLLVGRTDDVVLPSSVLTVPSVGENAWFLTAEAVLDLEPDLIIADSLLLYNEVAYEQLRNAGIPIYIGDTSAPDPTMNPLDMSPEELYNFPTIIDHTCSLMQNLTEVVGHHEQVATYVNWAQSYNKLVKDRIAELTPEQQVTVYIDWYSYRYSTWGDVSVYQAGGFNIACNQTINYPLLQGLELSPEFIVEQNPAVIISLISSATHDVNDFIGVKNDVLTLPQIRGVDAVTNGRIYVCDFAIRNGPRSIIGYLFYAKSIQPDLFSDIDLDNIIQQVNQYFDTPVTGTYCYP